MRQCKAFPEWTSEGERKGISFIPIMRDGVGFSVIKDQRMMVRMSGHDIHVKPGGTAGLIINPVPAETLGQGIFYLIVYSAGSSCDKKLRQKTLS